MMYKNEKGVTLAALVIVIIVMLILAGTTASLGINGGGLVSRTYNAVNEWNQSYEEEEGEHGKIKETLTAGEQYVDF